MSATYHMAKAYQEQLLREAEPAQPRENPRIPAASALRPKISAVVDRLAAPLMLHKGATDAKTTA